MKVYALVGKSGTGKSYQAQPFPEFIQKIITNGGLVESIRRGDIK